MAHVAELDGKAQPVGGSATLPDDGEVVFAEGVVPDEIMRVVGRGEQARLFGGGEDRATRHGSASA